MAGVDLARLVPARSSCRRRRAFFDAAIELVERGTLGGFILISTQRVLVGFAIGASLGLLLGAVTGLARTWDLFFGSTLGAIRAVPSLAWVPLLILWLKIGEDSKITLIAIGAFFPVYTTVSGRPSARRPRPGRGRPGVRPRGVRLFTTVQLPAVLPSVISGLRLGLAQSWLFLVAAELIASSAGSASCWSIPRTTAGSIGSCWRSSFSP